MRQFYIGGLLIAVAIALLLSPFASRSPDGLERVAQDKGFLERGKGKPVVGAPIPDYAIPGVKREWLSTALAGISGVLFTFGVVYGLGNLLKKCKRNKVP
jgi:cobalt/nickel transport protein